MSVERLRAEAGRWLLQAEDDLEAAEALNRPGNRGGWLV